MKTLILDGYNVIHAIPELKRELDKGLLRARQALMNYCSTYLARVRDVRRIIVVFDGDERFGGNPRTRTSSLVEIYTHSKEDADDRIIGLVHRETNKSRLAIVSNDNYVFNNVRGLGAAVIGVQEFAGRLNRPPKRASRSKKNTDEDERESLSYKDARRITEEYRRQLEKKLNQDD